MPEQEKTDSPEVNPDNDAPSLAERLKSAAASLGWLALVAVLSMVAHALLFASNQQPEADPIDEIAQRVQYELGHEITSGEMREFDLGQFSTSLYRHDLGITLRLDFQVSLVVHTEDARRFERFLETSRHRLRDDVLTVLNRIGTEELLDPKMRELKSAVADSANTMVGEPIVVTATFAEFSFMDQM